MLKQLLPLAFLVMAVSTSFAQQEPSSPSDAFYYQNNQMAYGSGCTDSCSAGCCRGRDACCSSVERVTEERSCWKVECEKICVPSVVCPWSEGGSGLTIFNCLKKKCCWNSCGSCCGESCGCCVKPRCGQIRSVRVLDSEDYEVTKCKCKWEIRRLPPCGSSCGCGE